MRIRVRAKDSGDEKDFQAPCRTNKGGRRGGREVSCYAFVCRERVRCY